LKSYIVTVDIAEYNSYKMEVFADNISKANDIIMKYNKDVVNKDVSLTLFEPSTDYCSNKSPRCTNITFLSVEYLENGTLVQKSLASKEIISFSKNIVKFNYLIKIAEFNRHTIIVNDVSSMEQIVPILRSEKKIKSKYKNSLISIGTKPKSTCDNNIIVLDISENL
jgi:phage FluMu protein Com